MYNIDGWTVDIDETVAIEQIFRRTLGEDAVELYHDLLAEIRCLQYDLDQAKNEDEGGEVNSLICDIRDIADEVENLLDVPRLTKDSKNRIKRKVKAIWRMADDNVGMW